MQVCKTFIKILNKNRGSIIMYFVIFMVLSLLLSGNGSEGVSEFNQEEIRITVFNEDEGELGGAIEKYLSEKNDLVEIENDAEVLKEELYYREIGYVLYIPKDFTEKFILSKRENLLGNMKIQNTANAEFIENQIEQYLTTLGMYIDCGFDTSAAIESSTADLALSTQVTISSDAGVVEESLGYYYFKFLAYILICIMISGLSPILLVFRKKDINARNLVSPMSIKRRNIELVIGSVIMMAFTFIIFVSVLCVIYRGDVFNVKCALGFMNMFCYILVATAIAFVASNVVTNLGTLNMVSNIVALGMSFLGGVFVSLEIMSDNIKLLSKFVPSYWYVIANDEIHELSQITSITAVSDKILMSFGIQLLFALAIFSVGFAISKARKN